MVEEDRVCRFEALLQIKTRSPNISLKFDPHFSMAQSEFDVLIFVSQLNTGDQGADQSSVSIREVKWPGLWIL